jgi:hypothetical protein
MNIKRDGLHCCYELIAGIHVLVSTRPINKLKLMPDDLVHLHSRNGVFRISEVGCYYFVVKDNHEDKYCLNEDFKCKYIKQ